MVCPGSHTSTHAAERDISNEIDESHNTEYIGIRNTYVYQRRTKQFGVRVDIELKSARTKRSTYNHMTYASSPSKSIQMLRHEAMHAKNCKQLLQRMRRTSSWSNPSPCCCITIPCQSRVYNASKVLEHKLHTYDMNMRYDYLSTYLCCTDSHAGATSSFQTHAALGAALLSHRSRLR